VGGWVCACVCVCACVRVCVCVCWYIQEIYTYIYIDTHCNHYFAAVVDDDIAVMKCVPVCCNLLAACASLVYNGISS